MTGPQNVSFRGGHAFNAGRAAEITLFVSQSVAEREVFNGVDRRNGHKKSCLFVFLRVKSLVIVTWRRTLRHITDYTIASYLAMSFLVNLGSSQYFSLIFS